MSTWADRHEELWLMLSIKSFTLSRTPKQYQLTLQNHHVHQIINIEQSFKHNYEYVYQLWKCRSVERELIKVVLFEEEEKDGIMNKVKRGEAHPLITYSKQGDGYQFYSCKKQTSSLILRFRVDSISNIQRDTGKIRQQPTMELSTCGLQEIKKLGESAILDQFQKQIIPSEFKQDSHWHKKSKNSHQSSFSMKIDKDINLELARREGAEVVTPQRTQNVLSNTKYLHSATKESSQRQPSQNKSKIYLNQSNFKPKRITTQNNQLTDRSVLQQDIKKKRSQYLNRKAPVIFQRSAYSPLPLSLQSPSSQKQSEVNGAEEQQCYEESQVKTQIYYLQNWMNQEKGIKPQSGLSIGKQQNNLVEDEGNSIKTNNKIQQREEISDSLSPPQQLNSSQKQIPKIISKSQVQKLQQKYQEISPIQLSQNNEPKQTPSSRTKIQLCQKNTQLSIQIFNLKVKIINNEGKSQKRLVVMFQGSRYCTQIMNSEGVLTRWDERLRISHCGTQSFIDFRLLSCTGGGQERSQGLASASIRSMVQNGGGCFKVGLQQGDTLTAHLSFNFTSSHPFPTISQNHHKQYKKFSLPKINTQKHQIKSASLNKKQSLPKKSLHQKRQSLSRDKLPNQQNMRTIKNRHSTCIKQIHLRGCVEGSSKIRDKKLKAKLKGR